MGAKKLSFDDILMLCTTQYSSVGTLIPLFMSGRSPSLKRFTSAAITEKYTSTNNGFRVSLDEKVEFATLCYILQPKPPRAANYRVS